MADGTFAVAMILAGLLDMGHSGCFRDGGCLERGTAPRRLSFSVGQIVERRAKPAAELYLRYEPGRTIGPFGLVTGLSFGENNEIWAGIGLTYDLRLGDSPFFAELHTMPGLYAPNGGFDLGALVEFRSGLELGFEDKAGWRYGLSYDHRSNTGLFSQKNPGIETLQIRVTAPLRR